MRDRQKLIGEYRVQRYDQETGEFLGEIRARNAITTNGKNLFLDVGIGASSATLSQGNAVLEVLDGGASQVFSQTSADSGFPNTSTLKQVEWQWSDQSTNQYTVDTIRFRQGSLTGTIFSEVTGGPFADNSKPDTENWIYSYTLTISESGTNLTDAGLDNWLDVLVGSGDTWSQMELNVIDNTNSLSATVGQDSSPSRSGQTVTMVFTAGDGQAEIRWEDVDVQQALTDLVLSSKAENFGPKGSGETWEFTYTFSV